MCAVARADRSSEIERRTQSQNNLAAASLLGAVVWFFADLENFTLASWHRPTTFTLIKGFA
jgi:hypothetical protein